jgi:type I restriction enzyme R subunit
MRTVRALQPFKIVVVTDRTDLEKQLSKTAALTGESVERAKNKNDLEAKLRAGGPGIVFGMIQKARDGEDNDEVIEFAQTLPEREPLLTAAEPTHPYTEALGLVDRSDTILLLVDEAHRSHSNRLHDNLMQALPDCAMIGFTGTPILGGWRRTTTDIFGGFIDQYLLRESEEDGATVPILFEGRTYSGAVRDGANLDRLFEDLFASRTEKERRAIRKKYAAEGNVLEAKKLVAAKAEDMLRHYVDSVLPNGFKAMIAAASRRAAVRYQESLVAAQSALVAQLEALAPEVIALPADALATKDADTQFLVRAHRNLDVIRRLEFAAVISPGSTNEDPGWKVWSRPRWRSTSSAS